MGVNFNLSETKKNLMRAFAGESQARNRYTIAAEKAKNANLHVIEAIFTFTANQEKAHAKVYMDYLKDLSGDIITIDGGYPVEVTDSITELLKFAARDEFEEHDDVYKSFAKKAMEEGFPTIANAFENIGEVEQMHGERFEKLADLIEQNQLFVNDVECAWMCLNCGHIYRGMEAPVVCPVCSHNQGFFIRVELAPFTA